jgi:pyruvate dehydrogenase E2 component (dihydrolipoyllysine-residue acetyltransferase)
MTRSFELPDLGEGIHEAEVIAVLVSAGDRVNEGDPILEVETDKAAVEIPSPFTAAVSEIMVKPGDIIKVGEVLIKFTDSETTAPATEKEEAPPKSEMALGAAAKPALVRGEGPVPASPATRRLARELGVDLNEVPPTGHGGVVTADDVRAYAEGGKQTPVAAEPESTDPDTARTGPRPITIELPQLPDFTKRGPVERVPVRSIRRATAKQMSLSWRQIPHVTSQAEIDITKLEAFRQKHKTAVGAKDGKLTLTVFALKAAATALKAYPKFNSSLDIGSGEILLKRYYDIGVAVDTEEGLIVPVLRDVDRKSITELAIELNGMVKRAHARKTPLEELQGGTFTITNMGSAGGEHFSPIINYPQVAILGIGAARMKPVVIEKQAGVYDIVPRLILPIVITFDHRVLDGGDAQRFSRVMIETLEDPDVLMMTMT